jgi:hypothetical protein
VDILRLDVSLSPYFFSKLFYNLETLRQPLNSKGFSFFGSSTQMQTLGAPLMNSTDP